MPNPSFRVSNEFYEKMKVAAEAGNMSLSDFIRTAVERALSNNGQPSDIRSESLTAVLREQIQEKDEQIRELHQLLGITQKNLGEISQQLDRATRQLEDQRKRLVWWQFWKQKAAIT